MATQRPQLDLGVSVCVRARDTGSSLDFLTEGLLTPQSNKSHCDLTEGGQKGGRGVGVS